MRIITVTKTRFVEQQRATEPNGIRFLIIKRLLTPNFQENKKFKLNDDTQQPEYIHNSLFDYDAYDAQIFTIPSSHGTW